MGTGHTLNHIRNERIDKVQGFPLTHYIRYLRVDSQDRFWLVCDDQLHQYQGGHFQAVKDGDSDKLGQVIAPEEDSRHEVWASVQDVRTKSKNALLRIQDMRVAEKVYSPANVDDQILNVLVPNLRGGLWGSGYEHGLYWFHDGKFEEVKPDGFDGIGPQPDFRT